MQSPRDLIYGLWRDETFVVLGAEWAKAAAAELEGWEHAATVGDARRLTLQSPILGSPVPKDPEEFYEQFDGYRDSDAFSLDECTTVVEGDWPRCPQA